MTENPENSNNYSVIDSSICVCQRTDKCKALKLNQYIIGFFDKNAKVLSIYRFLVKSNYTNNIIDNIIILEFIC